jgi:DNA-binding NarL/FixJ family response regulator
LTKNNPNFELNLHRLNSKIIIYLADDHEIVANGLSALLSSLEFVQEVRTFSNGKLLFKACLNKKPDIVFLDIEMPEWNGLETVKKLKIDFHSLPCIMLSMLNEKAIVQECISLGANGFLNKDCSLDELKESITSVMTGTIYYSNEIQKTLSNKAKNKGLSDVLKESLSEREHEILKLFCDGLTPKEIADALFLSTRTVETHKNNIMHKMQVNSIGKLISVALKSKLV